MYGFTSEDTATTSTNSSPQTDLLADNLLNVKVGQEHTKLYICQVFFSTTNNKKIEDNITYTIDLSGGTFWSSLGGVLSLFLGVSFASLFEFVEIIIDFCSNLGNYVMGHGVGRANHHI